MNYQKLISLPWKLERNPPPFEGNEIKFPESFARHVIKNHTKPGDIIFDPFAGLGTTLFVAEEMGRTAFGFETDLKKQQWVAGQLQNWTHLIHDDAANLQRYNLPKMDLLLTSPPYMPRHHKWNPLYNGNPKHAGYEAYLKRAGQIFAKIKNIIKPNAPVILQIDNLRHGKIYTPLVRDMANVLNQNFIQIDETIVKWDNPKPDYPFTCLLHFKKR